MVPEEYRVINRAIALIDNDWQDEREEARAALHKLFRQQCAQEAIISRRGINLTELGQDLETLK